MARYRSFLFHGSKASESRCVLDSRESHHLVRVFRARAGETVDVLDGKGRIYHGKLSRADAKAAEISVHQLECFEPASLSVCLLQAMPKGKAMDLILRMATEIGVARVQPIFTEHGELQMKGERLQSKLDKWRITMIEACKQCGLPFLPELMEPIALQDWLQQTQSQAEELRIVASLEAGSRPLRERLEAAGPLRSAVLAVGPEGDFSEGEYTALSEANFQSVRLGRQVLRAETAAAYLLSVVDQYAFKV